MNTDTLLALHDSLCGEAKRIMVAKNHDYSGDRGDPFANFRGAEIYDIHPVIGILLRIGDKLKRVETFIDKGLLAVKGDGVRDAIVDAINYLVLAGGMIAEEREIDELFANLESDFRETCDPAKPPPPPPPLTVEPPNRPFRCKHSADYLARQNAITPEHRRGWALFAKGAINHTQAGYIVVWDGEGVARGYFVESIDPDNDGEEN